MNIFSSKKSKIIAILLVITVGISIYFITREEKDYDEIARQNRDEVVVYLKDYIESLNDEGFVIDTYSGHEVKDRKLIEEMIEILENKEVYYYTKQGGGFVEFFINIGEVEIYHGKLIEIKKNGETYFYVRRKNWDDWVWKVIEKAEQNEN